MPKTYTMMVKKKIIIKQFNAKNIYNDGKKKCEEGEGNSN